MATIRYDPSLRNARFLAGRGAIVFIGAGPGPADAGKTPKGASTEAAAVKEPVPTGDQRSRSHEGQAREDACEDGAGI